MIQEVNGLLLLGLLYIIGLYLSGSRKAHLKIILKRQILKVSGDHTMGYCLKFLLVETKQQKETGAGLDHPVPQADFTMQCKHV